MDHHEYVAGFFGVLIGFTLTELIKGVADIFKNLDKVKYYFPHGLFIVFMFFVIILNFFDFYKFFRMVEVWTPLLLIRYTFPSIFVCFFCYMLFPSFRDDETVDFRKHYFKVVPMMYLLALVMFGLILVRNIFFIKTGVVRLSNIIVFSLILISLVSLAIKKDWTQYTFLGVGLPAIVYWTVTLTLE